MCVDWCLLNALSFDMQINYHSNMVGYTTTNCAVARCKMMLNWLLNRVGIENVDLNMFDSSNLIEKNAKNNLFSFIANAEGSIVFFFLHLLVVIGCVAFRPDLLNNNNNQKAYFVAAHNRRPHTPDPIIIVQNGCAIRSDRNNAHCSALSGSSRVRYVFCVASPPTAHTQTGQNWTHKPNGESVRKRSTDRWDIKL